VRGVGALGLDFLCHTVEGNDGGDILIFSGMVWRLDLVGYWIAFEPD
jgi:hypothetical protein